MNTCIVQYVPGVSTVPVSYDRHNNMIPCRNWYQSGSHTICYCI